jgi:dTDP-4-dehydrorhamnose reductase
MKLLITGADGMLGHQLVKSLSVNHTVKGVTRRDFLVEQPGGLAWVLDSFGANVIINCVGIVKQRAVMAPDDMIRVNSVFPHELARLARYYDARLIHFSTDCVFSGRKGHYTENDEPDPQDLYGRTKLLGEVYDQGCLTLRTSIIGRELKTKQGLVEWFLQQQGMVRGYIHHTFTGLTTIEMARVVERVLRSPDAHGVFHVGGLPVSKAWLLEALAHEYGLPTKVIHESGRSCNRCLDSSRFQKYFGYEPPRMQDMIKEMAHAER